MARATFTDQRIVEILIRLNEIELKPVVPARSTQFAMKKFLPRLRKLNEGGHSLADIAAVLNQEGVPATAATLSIYFRKSSRLGKKENCANPAVSTPTSNSQPE